MDAPVQMIGSCCTLTTRLVACCLCSMIDCSKVWVVMQCSKGSRERRWLDAPPAGEAPREHCSSGSHWVCGTRLLGLEEALTPLSVHMSSLVACHLELLQHQLVGYQLFYALPNHLFASLTKLNPVGDVFGFKFSSCITTHARLGNYAGNYMYVRLYVCIYI